MKILPLLHGILLLVFLALAETTQADDVRLLATDTGISVGTPLQIGDGTFKIAAPVIINTDIYKPVRPEVEVIDDNTLALKYPNNAKITISLAGAKATISYSGMPAEATAISMKMDIPRDAYQGAKYAIDGRAAEPFPEEDERKVLSEGKADAITLIDPSDNGVTIKTPNQLVKVLNKGPEGWSLYSFAWRYTFSDHPNETSYTIDLSPTK